MNKKISNSKIPQGKNAFDTLSKIIAALRDPDDGCPWDLEQTHSSIRKYFIEETYEAVEAIDNGDDAELANELGDVLLQVMLHSQIAKERGAFDIEDVVKNISNKMVRRHPHVFSDHKKLQTPEEVKENWIKIKKLEKLEKNKDDISSASILNDIPKSLPALNQAGRIGEKVSKLGFDWPAFKEVWKKVEEEKQELEEALSLFLENESKDNSTLKGRVESEMGDLLFSLAQAARHLEISPEDSLRGTCKRFIKRFNKLEEILGENSNLKDFSVEELEENWQKAKVLLKENATLP